MERYRGTRRQATLDLTIVYEQNEADGIIAGARRSVAPRPMIMIIA